MITKNFKFCSQCGELYEKCKSAKNHSLCPACRDAVKLSKIPEPDDLGTCTCWYDGLDYKIRECNTRRALARQRKAEGKPYQMPQCGKCTPDMPKKVELDYRCYHCFKSFQPRTGQQHYCCEKCARAAEYKRRKDKEIRSKLKAQAAKS